MLQRIALEDGAYLELYESWLEPALSVSLFAQLLHEIPWEERTIRMFGKEVREPRLVAWVGEPEAVYTYSGRRNLPRPFTPGLTRLRAQLERELSLPFNAVLCNLYRDGRDSMGLHSDAEPELGPEPVVASLSLGATRRFRLLAKRAACPSCELALAGGSLLVMRGSTQRHYRHGIPKELRVRAPRINLTFRQVRAGT